MNERHPKGLPVGPPIRPRGPEITLTELNVSRVRSPPLEEPIHWERTITPAVPLEIATKSSARPVRTAPMAIVGGGSSARPFTLKNLEAPSKFSGIKHPVTTT